MTWQSELIEGAERQIAWARANMAPGQIGAVPLVMTTEIDEIPLEQLGEQPPYPLADHHRRSEEDFNALVAIELSAGRITLAAAEQAESSFHTYISGNRYAAPQTSPRFFQ